MTGDLLRLEETYQRGLGADRHDRGIYYTPPWLVERLLDTVLEPALDDLARAGRSPAEVRVCDPACGSGRFLVAAARRIAARGVPITEVVSRCLVGLDTDPAGLALAERALRDLDPAGSAAPDLRLVDALSPGVAEDLGAHCDVVVGNPPFGTRLRRGATAPVHAPRDLDGVRLGPCTDLSAAFLVRATTLLAPGGRACLVQPRSLLAARDAAPVRAALRAAGALTDLWLATGPVFPDTPVLTCAPTVRAGAVQGVVRVSRGHEGAAARPLRGGAASGTWGHLEDPAAPDVPLPTTHHVGDVARCTADFRDQFYGLVGHVAEAAEHRGPGARRLVTSGAIDPAALRWGTRPVRFAGQSWRGPVVLTDALPPPMARWAAERSTPKVLVATQGAVLEAVADPDGDWLPGVPVISVVAPAALVWHLLAALLSPPLTALAVRDHAGGGLSVSGLRLAAREVAALPLPGDVATPSPDWDRAAALVREAQHAATDQDRARLLVGSGRRMIAAYGLEPVAGEGLLSWWAARAARCVPHLPGLPGAPETPVTAG